MKIMIFGADGSLGQQLVDVFNDHKVFSFTKKDIDVTYEEAVATKVTELSPDIIINATAFNDVDACEEEALFKKAQAINGEAVGFLADAALSADCILVHYSTDYVFAGESETGYAEDANTSPINNYGITKLMGEKEILNRISTGLKWYIIRTTRLFGPQGESKDSKPSFFDLMLHLAKENKELSAVDEEISCFTYTPDLAQKTKELIEQKYPFGIYHIVNSCGDSWFSSAKKLFAIVDIPVQLKPVSGDSFKRKAKRPKFSILLNTKLEPLRPWEDALKEYLKLL